MSDAAAKTIDGSLRLFIMGSARSGTSITYSAVRHVVGIDGHGEGHVIPIFTRMIDQFNTYAQEFSSDPGTLASELDTRQIRRLLSGYVSQFYRLVYKGQSFVDKTPGAASLLSVPFIRESFPDARIIVTRRTGVEVVQSFQLKFGLEFQQACHAWVDFMEALLKSRKLELDLLEIDQYDLTNSAAATGERLAEYLGRPERAGELADFFSRQRIEQTSKHNWRQRLTMEAANWSDAEKDTFRRICGPNMEAFGYPM
jgi:hypothetical protein